MLADRLEPFYSFRSLLAFKQKFRPHPDLIAFWYPPKWGINDAASRHLIRPSTPTSLFTTEREDSLNLREYQERTQKTDLHPGTDEKALMIPLAGLAGETGELLSEYKKYLRDGESHKLFKERIAEEVGDLLWYLANVATKFGLDLAQVAAQNLAKCEGRWGALPVRKPFDADAPEGQKFPRRFVIDFATTHDKSENPFVRVYYDNKPFGNELDDNSPRKDGYAYHDALHLSFAAILRRCPHYPTKPSPPTPRASCVPKCHRPLRPCRRRSLGVEANRV